MKAFNFPDVDLNAPVMDGYAALRILNTPNHPNRSEVQSRCHLTQRTVGDKFLKLLAASESIMPTQEVYDFDAGGGQYVENPDTALLRNPQTDEFEDYTFNFDCEERDLSVGDVMPYGRPDEEDLADAYDEAMEEIELLKLAKYKVDYYNPIGGWMQRHPRIGDLVDIPVDLQTDWETEEPLEARPSAANHLYDDRWFDNHRPNTLTVGSNSGKGRGSFSPDPIVRKMKLWDFINEPCLAGAPNSRTFAMIADRQERDMLEVAIWKLAEYGDIIIEEKIQRRYGIRPSYVKGRGLCFTSKQVARFLRWVSHARFQRNWEYQWILSNIYVYHSEQEPWTYKRPFTANQRLVS